MRAHAVCTSVAIGLTLSVAILPAAFGRADTAAAVQPVDEALRDYLSGNGLLNRGLYELAADEYRKFLAQHPQHDKAPVARYGLSVALFRMQKLDQAAVELGKLEAMTDFEFAAEVSVMAGQCHLVAGRFAEAANAFGRALSDYPDHELADDAAAGKIEALYRLKEHKAAVEGATQFASRHGDSPLRERVDFFAAVSEMAAENYGPAAEKFVSFLKGFPASAFSDQAVLRLAQCRQKTGDANQAIQNYQKVLDRPASPQHADALFALGALLYQEGRHDQAAEAVNRLLENYPETPHKARAVFQRAQILFAKEQFAEALQAFETAGKLSDELADRAAYWAAKCQLKREKFSNAADRLGAALERFSQSPLRPEMYYDRAVALLRAEKEPQAAAALEQFRAEFPDHTLTPRALHMLAAVFHRAREYDRSAQYAREFVERFGNNELAGAVAFLIAENEFLAGRYDPAAIQYRTFLATYENDPQAAPARYRLGVSLYRLEKFGEAEPLLAEAAASAEKDETFRPALLALGDIHFERGEWKQAESFFKRYLELDASPSGADDALIKLAYARQQQGRLEEALADYERLISSFPDSPGLLQAQFERGQALAALKRPDEARRSFEEVLKKGGDDSRFAAYALNHLGAIAAQKSEHEAAADFYARAGRAGGASDIAPEMVFQQAQAQMAARHFDKAEATLQALLKDHPDFSKCGQAQAQLAIALSRQDRHQDAVQAIERIEGSSTARLDDTTRASLQYEKAWCLRAMGKTKDAAAAYRQLLADSPGSELNPHAMLELGELEAADGRYDEAAQVLRTLRERLTGSPQALATAELMENCLYRLAVCEFELARHSQAAELFEELIGHFQTSSLMASASFFAGEASFKNNQYERAAQHLDRVVRQYSSDPAAEPALLRLGEALAALQRWAASEQAFQEYLSRFGNSPSWYQAQFGLGWARENQRRYDDAIRDYEKIIAKHPGPTGARAQFQIGECLFAKGNYEDAARELLKVDILYAYPQWSAAAIYEAGRCFEKLGKSAEARNHFEQVVQKHKETEWATLASRRLAELASSSGIPGR